MPLIAANNLITIGNFGKPGENCHCEKDIVHFWGNSMDAGLQIILRENHRLFSHFSFAIRGEIHFNTEWGRLRFEGYDNLSAEESCFADDVAFKGFQVDPKIFRPFIFKLGKKSPPLRKVQFVFVGPAMIDIELCDFIVE